MGAVWAAICASKLGRWVAGIAITLAGLGAMLLITFQRGKRAQSEEDAAKQAEEQAAFGRLAQQTQTDAGAAVAKVQQDAAKRPPPNPEIADDFDNTHL